MTPRREMGRELAAPTNKGAVAGDLDRAVAELRAAASAFGIAHRRYLGSAAGEGPADDPRPPVEDLVRVHAASAWLNRLIRIYLKIILKRTLGDRRRSDHSTVRRLERLRDTLGPARLAIEPFTSLFPDELEGMRGQEAGFSELIERIKNRGLPRRWL